MTSAKRFEELPVWQSAAQLYDLVDALLENKPAGISSTFRDQLERATLSVSNNIAEGIEREAPGELLKFIYLARGATGEVRSMLTIMQRKPRLSNLKSQISYLISLSESCSRQLKSWADAYLNGDSSEHQGMHARSLESFRKEKDTARIRKDALRVAR